MHVCMYVCMYANTHVCMYICKYACIYVCNYVYFTDDLVLKLPSVIDEQKAKRFMNEVTLGNEMMSSIYLLHVLYLHL